MKERNNKIKVYDAIMGSGKTHKAIERMKKYVEKDVKFIYITPFLDEITRVKNELPENSVFIPLSKDDNNSAVYEYQINYLNEDEKIDLNNPKISYKYLNKRTQFLKFANKSKSIIATHSLFRSLKKEDYRSIAKDYILILDEVISPLDLEYIGKEDINILKEQNLILINEVSNEVKFINDDYNDSAFRNIKKLCASSTVFHLDEYFFVWIFPIDIFKSFKEVQILTYLFEGSLLSAYFKLFKFDYILKSDNSIETLNNFKELLNIYNGRSNKGKNQFSFSVSACKNITKNDKKISNSTSNIFKKVFKTPSKNNAFTTFKDNKTKFSGSGYAKGFIPVNARATNDFRHKTSMAYLANRYFKPQHISFFRERGIILNEDLWALSELVQWLWRGCIRDDKKMNLYIPSYRMRNLLIRWLDGEFLTENSVEINNEKVA